MGVPANTVRIIIFVVAVAAVVIVMFVTGWADDKAPPGSGGRVPVTDTGANDESGSGILGVGDVAERFGASSAGRGVATR